MTKRKNNTFIISAPSGTGKSTLIELLLTQIPQVFFSISHTTRPPRVGEKNGVEYYFIDNAEFEEMIRRDEFLEWAQVHGYYYGTSREMVRRSQEEGRDLLLDIDFQGAQAVRKQIPEAVSIFIMPPSLDILKERLLRRQKDTLPQIQSRTINARTELQHYKEYEFVIINEDLGSAFEYLASIVRSQRSKQEIMEERIQKVLESFKIPAPTEDPAEKAEKS
jgi:guanylate kinase